MLCRDLLLQEAPGKKRGNTDDIEESAQSVDYTWESRGANVLSLQNAWYMHM